MPGLPSNREHAQLLERVAELYEVQHASPFRVRAYRQAGKEIEASDESIAGLADVKEGHRLEDLPGIGKSIAASIREYVHSGRLRLLDRLEGEVSPVDLFCTVPGIGEELAHHLHEELHIETLEELELAAVIDVPDEAVAFQVANDTDFGLGAAVFTDDEQRGMDIAEKQLEAGACFVNTFVKSDPRLPFGGVKTSGYGRELGLFGIREFVNIKTVFMA